MKHLLCSQQFDKPRLENLFSETDRMVIDLGDPKRRESLGQSFLNRILCIHFYVRSLRTSHSFKVAAIRLGMHVISAQTASEFSSNIRGESLEHSIRVIAGYGVDVIALRHTGNGGAERAASVIDKSGLPVSIINAGDGTGQHPSQSLIDLYAVSRLSTERKIDGSHIVIGGNLMFGRTVRSLAYLLSKFNVSLTFLSPKELAVGQDILRHLDEHNVKYRISYDPVDALPEADIIYWTNFHDGEPQPITSASPAGTYSFVLNPTVMKLVKSSAIVLHPLPMRDEISKEAQEDPRMRFFKQSDFSVPLRAAILKILLEDSVHQ